MNPVLVPAIVYDGLIAVRDSGRINMLDRPGVANIAAGLGFRETADWIRANKKDFATGIFCGFMPVQDPSPAVGA